MRLRALSSVIAWGTNPKSGLVLHLSDLGLLVKILFEEVRRQPVRESAIEGLSCDMSCPDRNRAWTCIVFVRRKKHNTSRTVLGVTQITTQLTYSGWPYLCPIGLFYTKTRAFHLLYFCGKSSPESLENFYLALDLLKVILYLLRILSFILYLIIIWKTSMTFYKNINLHSK